MTNELENVRARYPEKSLQLATVAWLSEHLGFEEVFGDLEAVGARFDSAGFIGRKPVLIEFKTSVPESMVVHRDDRPMSIESKVAGCLGALYSNRHDDLSEAVNQRWTRSELPLVVVAANSFSRSGLEALQALFEARSQDWAFDYAAWRWTGTEVEALLQGECPMGRQIDYAQLVIPKLVGRAARPRARTQLELRAFAREAGLEQLFDAFVESATDEGYRLQTTRWGLGAYRGRKIFCAIYLAEPQNLDGLDAGIVMDHWDLDAPLPGSPAKPVGYLNTNRRLVTPQEVRQLFAGLRSSDGAAAV